MRKFAKRSLVAAVVAVFAVFSAAAQSTVTDRVIILPFENTSGKPEFNWVGESFAGSLSELLKVPGLDVVSNDERKIVQQRLRIPLSALPSLAASLKMARDSNANLLVSGRYNIIPADKDVAATINVNARIIRVNEGRLMTELIDGRQITRDINLTDALANLQTIQGQVAYQVLYQRDKSLPFSQNQLIESANKIPGRAFEAYIKGLITNDSQAREVFLINAGRLYADGISGGIYAEAALELGHHYLGQRKLADAIAAFERTVTALQTCREAARAEKRPSNCNDEAFAEASFYIGVIYWQQGNFESALAAMRPLTEELKLTTVFNALGSISVQASRAEKRNPGNAAKLLNEGIEFLKQASESDDDNSAVRFNYAFALFLNGNFSEAATQFRAALALNPRDGESYYMLAKTLEALNDPTAKDVDDQARRSLTEGNRYALLEREWAKAKNGTGINLRVDQPARKDFLTVVMSRRAATPITTRISETEALLVRARTLVKDGKDDEAMTALRSVLASEPMSAESYLLLGKIHIRRRDLDQAVSSLKTAIFWDSRLIESHVLLGKIFVERGNCLEAKNYSASALEIDPEDADALGLKRLTERCSK
ncbi:MAG: tetratricopeptide repeat protein [Acidobacteria bacterium]|nr:tetratricopeptide repeat protein [Acidobacteriota bacterium]